MEVRLAAGDPEIFWGITVAEVESDPAGGFRCEAVPPGSGFIVTAADRQGDRGANGEPESFASFDLTENLNAEPGQRIDLGTFDIKTGKRVEGPAGKR